MGFRLERQLTIASVILDPPIDKCILINFDHHIGDKNSYRPYFFIPKKWLEIANADYFNYGGSENYPHGGCEDPTIAVGGNALHRFLNAK